MNWHNLEGFISMGGYGLYVWGSYVMVLLWLVIEPYATWRRQRHAQQEISNPTGWPQ